MPIINIPRFGGMITAEHQEDIPDFASAWNKNVDPESQSQLRGINTNGSAITAAALNISDVYESAFIKSEISGLIIHDLVYIDKEDNDITIIADFYNTNPITITSSTDANPIVVTTAAAHHLNYIDATTDIGIKINISGHITNVAANGNHFAKRTGSTTFALYSNEALTTGVAGSGAGAGSGGTVNFPAFFDIEPSPGATPQSCISVHNQIQIGLGTTVYSRVVYRLISDKTFFNSLLTAAAGLYIHYDTIAHGTADLYGVALINAAVLGGAAGGYFQAAVLYSWNVSMVFDGIQESPLYTTPAQDTGAAGGESTATLTVRMNNAETNFSSKFWDKRITAIKVYRAESSDGLAAHLGLYRLVETIDINDSNWALNTPHYDITYTDNGGYPEGGATYEEETGIPETLSFPLIRYTLNTSGGGYHFAVRSKVPFTSWTDTEQTNWDRYIFRSKKFRPNMFDWTTDRVVIDDIPTDLAYYNDKLYVFTENKVYRINPELLYVEDTLEGWGVSKRGGVTVTEYGMFFCNVNGAYWMRGNEIITISDKIKFQSNAYSADWNNFAVDALSTPAHLGRIIVSFMANKRCVVFMGNDVSTATTGALVFYIPKEEWFYWDFGSETLDSNSGVVTGKDGELYFSGDTYLKKLCGGASYQDFDWVSKEFNLNKPSQNKVWEKIKWDGTVGTGTIAVKYGTNGTEPIGSGTTATNDAYINTYKKTMQLYFDCSGNAKVDSVDMLVRPLIGER